MAIKSQFSLGPTGFDRQMQARRKENVYNMGLSQNPRDPGYVQGLIGQMNRDPYPNQREYIAQGLAVDRRQALDAQHQQRQQEEAAMNELRGGLDQAQGKLSDAQKSLTEGPESAVANLEPYRQENQRLMAKREQEIDQLETRAEEAFDTYIQEATNLKQEALAALEDNTPARAEQSIRAMTQNAESRKQDIVNQYAQMGMGQDHPAVQAALERVDSQTMQQTSDVWQRAAIAFDDASMQVRANYDSYLNAAEAGKAQARTAMAGAAEQGLGSLVDQNRAFAQLEASLRQQAETAAVQLQAQAAQLDLQGSVALAEMMRDQTIAWSPISPILTAGTVFGGRAPQPITSATVQNADPVFDWSGARTSPGLYTTNQSNPGRRPETPKSKSPDLYEGPSNYLQGNLGGNMRIT
jgi:hypothetical protein